MYMVCDVGGTNCRFQVKSYDSKTQISSTIFEKNYKCDEYSWFNDIMDQLLTDWKFKFTHICCSLGGPIVNECCQIGTRYEWPEISKKQLLDQYNFEQVYFINDFEANGYGLLQNSTDYYEVLNQGIPEPNGNKLIIGPGTGLGVGLILFNKFTKEYEVHSSEGGRAQFKATTPMELRLLKFALKYLNDIHNEPLDMLWTHLLVRGPAIPMLYEFFKSEYPELKVEVEKTEDQIEVESSDIVNQALQNSDPLSLKVIDFFVKSFGIFWADMALMSRAYNGIYITGGVSLILKDYILNSDTFMSNFKNSADKSKILESIPVYVLTREIGWDGADVYLKQQLERK